MNDFWAKRLGQAQQPAQPPQQQAQQPGGYQPWWRPQGPAQPVQQPMQPQVQPQVQQVGHDPNGQVPLGQLLVQNHYVTDKAQSLKETEPCPSCGSNLYVGVPGSPNAMKTCGECGFNPRFQHSTHGISVTNEGLPQHTARGQHANVNDFNPKQIVGRVA